ncbi:MAG: NADH-quinone oxidoreductase subunit J [Thermodesulfovibrionales bacterium]
MAEVFFWYLAAAITALSLLVITRRNPVHSVLLMLVMFFHIAALYLFLNAEFMAAIQIIVYAGAILVLFLFVVLLLNLKEEVAERRYIGLWPLGLILAGGILVSMFAAMESFVIGPQGKYSTEYIAQETHVAAVGKVLYTEYLFPFEVASLVLLVAIIGAIVLAKKRLRS